MENEWSSLLTSTSLAYALPMDLLRRHVMISALQVSGMANVFGTSVSLLSEDAVALVSETLSGSDCRDSGGENVDSEGDAATAC